MAKPSRERARPADSETTDVEQPEGKHDVLMYLDRSGQQGCAWYSKPPGALTRDSKPKIQVPVHVRYVIPPRLGICPAAKWTDVKASQGYIDLDERGELKVFNPTGSIEDAWARAPTRSLVKMIEKSAGIEVLLRLQAMESEAESPRLEVSEEIDARLDELKVQLAKHNRKRSNKRRGNRRAA